ncbi:MAG TPA: sodium:solute symporter family protein [Rhodothermales bacterium]|nr:sodium:solute symporter family protein [Rhodothermales bacterium]
MALATLTVYILLQLAIGAYISCRIRTETDYIVAGRSLGPWLGTFTIFATWFGAETCIGAAGAVYEEGLAGARADPFGYGLCLLLMGAFLARPLYRRKLTTLADLYRQRYGPGVERLAVLLMVPASVLWAAAQVRAFGGIIAGAGGFEPVWGVTAAAVVVVLYTVFGGALADAYHDLIQGVVLLVGLVVLGGVIFFAGDGVEALTQVPAERFNPFTGHGVLDGIEKWAIPICGSVVAVELVSRIIACKSEGVAQRTSFQAAGLYAFAGSIPVLMGLVGAVQTPGLADPEGILPALAGQHLPAGLGIVFTGALVAAILSTVDSTLLVAGSLVSHNVVVPLRPGLSERGKLLAARVSVVAFAVIAYGLALGSESVYALVEESSAFGSAGLFMAVLMALFTRIGGAWAAVGALLGGFVTYILADKVLHLPVPYLTSLAAAGLGYGLGALLDRGHTPEAPDVAPQVTGV